MSEEFEVLAKKLKKMLKYIKKEHDSIMENYSKQNIIHKSIPIKPTKKATLEQIDFINKIIDKTFVPSLELMYKMIDSGIVEWYETTEDVKLSEISTKDKKVEDLIYESWDKLYIYKHIKYDLTFDFIMQSYLFLEKEIIRFMNRNFVEYSKSKTLFSAIRNIEKELNKEISCDIKDNLDMYRNIINVYKHGNGQSLENIINNHSEILNFTNMTDDLSFLFNLQKVNLDNFYFYATELINAIES